MRKPKTRYKTIDATKPIWLEITEENVADAVCGDPEQCVIAQAFRSHCGDLFETIEVGATVTKVVRRDGVKVRYRTGALLRSALLHFDRTGQWDLPPGDYRLAPPHRSMRLENQPNNLHKMTQKQKNSPKKGRKKRKKVAPPTRRISHDPLPT